MIQVYDNLFSKEEQDRIEQTILGIQTPWMFNRAAAYKNNPEVSQENVSKLMSFSHAVLMGDELLDSQNWDLYYNMLVNIKKILPIESVFNTRVQLQLPLSVYPPLTPHIDSHTIPNYDYKVILYYVNDSDGDTLIYDKKATDTDIQNMNVIHSIEPVRGRIVVFDGDYYHSSSRPSKDIRCVVNFNVMVKQ